MTAVSSILVIGAGQAAAMAVAALREQGYEGTITVVGREAHAPYERPPLSKAVLAAPDLEEPNLKIHEDDFFAGSNIDLRLGAEVASLDAERQEAILHDGSKIQFDRCLIATGGVARALPGLPASAEQVYYIRTLDDARRLRTALHKAQKVLVVGAGFLGLEVASTARSMGVDVTVIESGQRVLSRVVPPIFSDWMQQRIQQSGVKLHLGQSIADIQLPDNGVRITASDDNCFEADLLVVAIGLVPDVALAQSAGIKINTANGGIEVDGRCRTSQPAIFAAGDCTSQHYEGHGSLRLESWQNANEQGRIAACAMLDKAADPAATPWFWTDQFDCNIQMLGLPGADLQYVVRGPMSIDEQQPKFMLLGLDKSKGRYAIAVNAGGDLRAFRPVLEQSVPIDNVAEFSDENTKMRAYVKKLLAAHAG